AVAGRELEAHAVDAHRAVALPLRAMLLGHEYQAERVARGARAADVRPGEEAREWCLAGLGVDSSVVLELAPGRRRLVERRQCHVGAVLQHREQPSLDLGQKFSCFPFWYGLCASVVSCTTPRCARPWTTSAAISADPLSVISARGSPRFWIACDRPCTRSSAFSSRRYHCAWQASRERSSSTPRS